jgi:hypothetical protein
MGRERWDNCLVSGRNFREEVEIPHLVVPR